jgi:hypothetical protein
VNSGFPSLETGDSAAPRMETPNRIDKRFAELIIRHAVTETKLSTSSNRHVTSPE